MVRVVSSDYPTRNSELVQVLRDELGFIVDHPPDDAARQAAEPFAEFVDGFGPTALRRMKVRQASRALGPEQLAVPRPPSAFGVAGSITDEACVPAFEHYSPQWSTVGGFPDSAGVHESEVDQTLADKLIGLKLAVPACGEWLAMNPELAWLYKIQLTEEMARRNNLVPATDQMAAHAVMDGPIDVRFLLGQADQPLKSTDFQAGFGLLSINAVIPRDLDQVPPAKIVEIRRRFAAQLDRWRQYSDEVAAQLEAELRDVESPQVLQAYLDDAVKRFSTGPAGDIKHGLVDVGLDAALTAFNTKFAVPAAAVTGLVAPRSRPPEASLSPRRTCAGPPAASRRPSRQPRPRTSSALARLSHPRHGSRRSSPSCAAQVDCAADNSRPTNRYLPPRPRRRPSIRTYPLNYFTQRYILMADEEECPIPRPADLGGIRAWRDCPAPRAELDDLVRGRDFSGPCRGAVRGCRSGGGPRLASALPGRPASGRAAAVPRRARRPRPRTGRSRRRW